MQSLLLLGLPLESAAARPQRPDGYLKQRTLGENPASLIETARIVQDAGLIYDAVRESDALQNTSLLSPENLRFYLSNPLLQDAHISLDGSTIRIALADQNTILLINTTPSPDAVEIRQGVYLRIAAKRATSGDGIEKPLDPALGVKLMEDVYLVDEAIFWLEHLRTTKGVEPETLSAHFEQWRQNGSQVGRMTLQLVTQNIGQDELGQDLWQLWDTWGEHFPFSSWLRTHGTRYIEQSSNIFREGHVIIDRSAAERTLEEDSDRLRYKLAHEFFQKALREDLFGTEQRLLDEYYQSERQGPRQVNLRASLPGYTGLFDDADFWQEFIAQTVYWSRALDEPWRLSETGDLLPRVSTGQRERDARFRQRRYEIMERFPFLESLNEAAVETANTALGMISRLYAEAEIGDGLADISVVLSDFEGLKIIQTIGDTEKRLGQSYEWVEQTFPRYLANLQNLIRQFDILFRRNEESLIEPMVMSDIEELFTLITETGRVSELFEELEQDHRFLAIFEYIADLWEIVPTSLQDPNTLNPDIQQHLLSLDTHSLALFSAYQTIRKSALEVLAERTDIATEEAELYEDALWGEEYDELRFDLSNPASPVGQALFLPNLNQIAVALRKQHLLPTLDHSWDESPERIWVIETRLIQVLYEIFKNALLYAEPPDPVELDIRTTGNQSVIEIANRGKTLTEEELNLVLKYGYTSSGDEAVDIVDVTAASYFNLAKGVGMGLPIAATSIMLMGGRLEVESGSHILRRENGTSRVSLIPDTQTPWPGVKVRIVLPLAERAIAEVSHKQGDGLFWGSSNREALLESMRDNDLLSPYVSDSVISLPRQLRMGSSRRSIIMRHPDHPDESYKIAKKASWLEPQDQSGNALNIHEAEVLVQLKDVEGIPKLLAMGVNEKGLVWIQLKGIPHAKDLGSNLWKELPPLQKMDAVIRASETLERVHKAGWVHHDMGPGNILVNANGQVMVIDFGLAYPIGTPVYWKGIDIISLDDHTLDLGSTPDHDIYRLGELFRNLFIDGEQKTFRELLAGIFPNKPASRQHISLTEMDDSGLLRLIYAMTREESEQRLSNVATILSRLREAKDYFLAQGDGIDDPVTTIDVQRLIDPEWLGPLKTPEWLGTALLDQMNIAATMNVTGEVKVTTIVESLVSDNAQTEIETTLAEIDPNDYVYTTVSHKVVTSYGETSAVKYRILVARKSILRTNGLLNDWLNTAWHRFSAEDIIYHHDNVLFLLEFDVIPRHRRVIFDWIILNRSLKGKRLGALVIKRFSDFVKERFGNQGFTFKIEFLHPYIRDAFLTHFPSARKIIGEGSEPSLQQPHLYTAEIVRDSTAKPEGDGILDTFTHFLRNRLQTTQHPRVNPYLNPLNITRGYSEEDAAYSGRITESILQALGRAAREGRKAEIAILGAGLVTGFTFRQAFSERLDEMNLHLVNGEPLSLPVPEVLSAMRKRGLSSWTGAPGELERYLQDFDELVTLHDLNNGMDLEGRNTTGQFDVILLASGTLEYINDKPGLLQVMKRSLRKDGVAFVQTNGFSMQEPPEETFYAALNSQTPEPQYERVSEESLIVRNRYPNVPFPDLESVGPLSESLINFTAPTSDWRMRRHVNYRLGGVNLPESVPATAAGDGIISESKILSHIDLLRTVNEINDPEQRLEEAYRWSGRILPQYLTALQQLISQLDTLFPHASPTPSADATQDSILHDLEGLLASLRAGQASELFEGADPENRFTALYQYVNRLRQSASSSQQDIRTPHAEDQRYLFNLDLHNIALFSMYQTVRIFALEALAGRNKHPMQDHYQKLLETGEDYGHFTLRESEITLTAVQALEHPILRQIATALGKPHALPHPASLGSPANSTLWVNASYLEHALIEILRNALFYAQRDTSIEFRLDHAPENLAIIEINNRGKELSEDEMRRVLHYGYTTSGDEVIAPGADIPMADVYLHVSKGQGMGLNMAAMATLLARGWLEIESGSRLLHWENGEIDISPLPADRTPWPGVKVRLSLQIQDPSRGEGLEEKPPVYVLLDRHGQPELTNNFFQEAAEEADVLWLEVRPGTLAIYREVAQKRDMPENAIRRIKDSIRLGRLIFEGRIRQDLETLYALDAPPQLVGEPGLSERAAKLRDQATDIYRQIEISVGSGNFQRALAHLRDYTVTRAQFLEERDGRIWHQWEEILRRHAGKKIRFVIGRNHRRLAQRLHQFLPPSKWSEKDIVVDVTNNAFPFPSDPLYERARRGEALALEDKTVYEPLTRQMFYNMLQNFLMHNYTRRADPQTMQDILRRVSPDDWELMTEYVRTRLDRDKPNPGYYTVIQWALEWLHDNEKLAEHAPVFFPVEGDGIEQRSNHVMHLTNLLGYLPDDQKLRLFPDAVPGQILLPKDILTGQVLNIGIETDTLEWRIREPNMTTHLRGHGVDARGLSPLAADSPEQGYVQGLVQNMHMFNANEFDNAVSVELFNHRYLTTKGRTHHDEYPDLMTFYRQAAREIKRVLRDGGRFVVTTGAQKNEAFLQALEEIGFERIPLSVPTLLVLINHKTSSHDKPVISAKGDGVTLNDHQPSREIILRLMNSLSGEITGPVYTDYDLKKYTRIGIGATATAFVEPSTFDDLQTIVQFANNHDIPFYVIGKTTNLLIAQDIIGLVISMSGLKEMSIDPSTGIIEAETGVLLTDLAKASADNNLTGLEFTVGIPGTLGGALWTAASYPKHLFHDALMDAAIEIPGKENGVPDVNDHIASLVEEVLILFPDGSVRSYSRSEMDFGYRTSRLQHEHVIAYRAKLKLAHRDSDIIRQTMQVLREVRKHARKVQPELENIVTRSLGRVFKNEDPSYGGDAASQLIVEAGAQKWREGDIRQIPGIPGAFYNAGRGTAQEYLKLLRRLWNAVRVNSGIMLIPEIRVIPHTVLRDLLQTKGDGLTLEESETISSSLSTSVEGDEPEDLLLGDGLDENTDDFHALLSAALFREEGHHGKAFNIYRELGAFNSRKQISPETALAVENFSSFLYSNRNAALALAKQLNITQKSKLKYMGVPTSQIFRFLYPLFQAHRIFTHPSLGVAESLERAQALREEGRYREAFEIYGVKNETNGESPHIVTARDEFLDFLEQDRAAAQVFFRQMEIGQMSDFHTTAGLPFYNPVRQRLARIFRFHDTEEKLIQSAAQLETDNFFGALQTLGSRTRHQDPKIINERARLLTHLKSRRRAAQRLTKQMGVTRHRDLRQGTLSRYAGLVTPILVHHGIFTGQGGARSEPRLAGHALHKKSARALNGIGPEEQLRLWHLMRAGDETARVRLVESLAFLVIETVERIAYAPDSDRSSFYIDDLVQEANFRLVQDIDHWDHMAWETGRGPSLQGFVEDLVHQAVRGVRSDLYGDERLLSSLDQPIGQNKHSGGTFTHASRIGTPTHWGGEFNYEAAVAYLRDAAGREYGLAEELLGHDELSTYYVSRTAKLTLRDRLRDYLLEQGLLEKARQWGYDPFSIHIVGSMGLLGVAEVGYSNLNLLFLSLQDGDAYSGFAWELSHSIMPGELVAGQDFDLSMIRVGFNGHFDKARAGSNGLANFVRRHGLGADPERGIATAEVLPLAERNGNGRTLNRAYLQASDPLLADDVNALLVLESEDGVAAEIQNQLGRGLGQDYRTFASGYLEYFIGKQVRKTGRDDRSAFLQGDGLASAETVARSVSRAVETSITQSNALEGTSADMERATLGMAFSAIDPPLLRANVDEGLWRIMLLSEGQEGRTRVAGPGMIEVRYADWAGENAEQTVNLEKLQRAVEDLQAGVSVNLFVETAALSKWQNRPDTIGVIDETVLKNLRSLDAFISRSVHRLGLTDIQEGVLRKALLGRQA